MARWWRWLRGWRPSQEPPYYVNDVGVLKPLTGHAFDHYLDVQLHKASFGMTCDFYESVWGEPIVGPKPKKDLLGLAGMLSPSMIVKPSNDFKMMGMS